MKRNFPDIFFLILILLVTFAFMGLIKGFIMSVFWAVVFAILFANTYNKTLKRTSGKENLAATLTLLYILLIVIIPLAITAFLVINQASEYYQTINQSEINIQERLATFRERFPVNEQLLAQFGVNIEEVEANIQGFITGGLQIVANRAIGLTQNVFGFFINFFLMLYILYFFIRDGRRLVEDLIWALPIGDEREWMLLRQFSTVSRATVKGSLVVALVQGGIGGLLFWAVGIPAAFIWGVIMVLLSLLPIGSALIWLPAAIILIVEGEVTRGIIVIAVGALFIGLIDNLLRPRLVGQDTKLPDYLVLLSTLGGLAWFGLSGFVIGPVVAALFVSCWKIMGVEYGGPPIDVPSPGAERHPDTLKELDQELDRKEEQLNNGDDEAPPKSKIVEY